MPAVGGEQNAERQRTNRDDGQLSRLRTIANGGSVRNRTGVVRVNLEQRVWACGLRDAGTTTDLHDGEGKSRNFYA